MKAPDATGQLVWCPSDPSLGVGLVTEREGPRVRVRFWRLQEERNYTTRGPDLAILRYEIGHGERVQDNQGKNVRVRRRLDKIRDGLLMYELEDGRSVLESELVPNVRDIGAKERLASLNLAHPEVVRARIEGLRLANFGQRPGYAAVLGSRVQWLPHQVDVATRAVGRDPVRMLLADEVGLGKTVEAALIYAGLRHEGRAKRVLILTPDALCIQWLGEIYRKSHELLVLMDNDRIEDAQRDFPDLSPFDAHQRIVASIDRLAADGELRDSVGRTSWDLVIVDEAHHLRWRPKDGGNPAYRLVESLAQNTRNLLLLTATPMALDPTEYHALLRLLDPTRFDNPAMFEAVATRAATIRNVARSVATALAQRAHVPEEESQAARAALQDDPVDQEALDAFLACAPTHDHRVTLSEPVLEALRQRHGLTDYVVRNRRGPVGGLPNRVPQVIALEPSQPQELLLEVGEGVMFDLAETMKTPKARNRAIGELLRALWATPRALSDILKHYSDALAQQLGPHIDAVVNAPLDAQGLPTGDMRLRWLTQLARGLDAGEKLLVFVESAVAVRALRDALEPLCPRELAMFHRELSPRDQDRQVAYFRDSAGPQIMLSTEAGGEGRNFQFCHRVVLYDLPWRPATVEQRIGRVDRVGQAHDVNVLVPYFKSGYEAAVLKIMEQSIGVLQRTVGGIDHALEYVSDQLAELILTGAPADLWKRLFSQTEQLVVAARQRIEAGVDPILDHASFSQRRAQAVLESVPADLEARTEAFVQRYAEHSKIEVRAKGQFRVAVDGAPGAAGRQSENGYVGTFSRTYALDHEDVEFLSFGHPLVVQAMEWAREADEASAGLALCRGCASDGAAFLWTFDLDLPDDAREAQAHFDLSIFAFALDETGARVAELDALLTTATRSLDRMDPTPLRASGGRWRKLVEKSHGAVEVLAQKSVEEAAAVASQRLADTMASRLRDLKRSQARELTQLKGRTRERKQLLQEHEDAQSVLRQEGERLMSGVRNARPRLVAALAIRLMRTKQVSA